MSDEIVDESADADTESAEDPVEDLAGAGDDLIDARDESVRRDEDGETQDGETIDVSALGDDSISEEAVVALIAERDEYLDALQRLKAEFTNARRRNDEEALTRRTQAAASLVEKLLPVLDGCDAALGQGIEEVRPVFDALFDVLSGQGLSRIDAVGEPFDPELHEAVLYEAGEGEQVVIEILRTGYSWNDRVLRAPMVKVQG